MSKWIRVHVVFQYIHLLVFRLSVRVHVSKCLKRVRPPVRVVNQHFRQVRRPHSQPHFLERYWPHWFEFFLWVADDTTRTWTLPWRSCIHGNFRGPKSCAQTKIQKDVHKVLERCQKLSCCLFVDNHDLGCCKAPSYYRRANFTLYLQLNWIAFYDSLLSLSVTDKSDWEFLVCYFFSLNWNSHMIDAVRNSHGKPETVFEWSACGGQQKADDGDPF